MEKQEKQVTRSIAELEQKQVQLEEKLNEAREELDRAKRAGGEGGKGKLWFLERQMFEADQCMFLLFLKKSFCKFFLKFFFFSLI